MEGSQVGALAQPVYVCDRCTCWQMDFRNQPLDKPDFFCINPPCGGTTFTRFGSKVEARMFGNLLLRVNSGELSDLKLQPRFPLHVTPPGDAAPILLWTYVADFAATVVATGERVIFEVKSGADTQVSEIKRKHCEIQYGFKIRMLIPA